jgi:hypothetical protein
MPVNKEAQYFLYMPVKAGTCKKRSQRNHYGNHNISEGLEMNTR